MPRVTLEHRSQILWDIHDYGVNLDTRELFLHKHLDSEDESMPVDYRMATVFIKNLRYMESLKQEEPILIHMNTDGGEWNYGMAIYDAIQFSTCHITILAYAHARSMSSIIFQAADTRVLMPNADFLFHYGTIYLGEIASLSGGCENEWNKHLNGIMLDLYAERCAEAKKFAGWSVKRIRTKLDREMKDKPERYMLPKEAVEWGFADGVLGDDRFPDLASLRRAS